MKRDLESMTDEFVAACHTAAAQGLMRCSSGNMSRRVDDETMLITASRTWMERLTREDVAICRLADAACTNGKKPSTETHIHHGTLLRRRDISVVLHFQSLYATIVCCESAPRPDFFVIPEIPFYIGPIGAVPYLHPGTQELADATVSALADHNLVTLRNHGMVVVGRTYDEAIQRAVFFELACGILVLGRDRVQALAPEAVARLRPESYG